MEHNPGVILYAITVFITILFLANIVSKLNILTKDRNHCLKTITSVSITKILPSILGFIIVSALYEYQTNLIWFSYQKLCTWVGMFLIGAWGLGTFGIALIYIWLTLYYLLQREKSRASSERPSVEK